MKRIACIIMALMVCLSTTALAATKLPDYKLITEGKQTKLGSSTGYILKSGSILMVPIKPLIEAVGLKYKTNAAGKSMTITSADGKKVEIKTGAKAMRVDGKTKSLRVSTMKQGGGLTADVRVLDALGLTAKHYKASKTTKSMGYDDGALVVAKKGGDTKLPDLGTGDSSDDSSDSGDSGDSDDPDDPDDATGPDTVALPDALKTAAKTATQIVGVKHSSGAKATLTLYEKNKYGEWVETLSTYAYVGRNGIDKTREGDKRTPTGTFDLKTPFGIKADPGAKLGGYLKVTKYHYWSGQNGKYYNKLVDTSKVDYTPSSADEHLIDYAGVYNYCMLIDYNSAGEDGKGSAIFLHCTGKNAYTAGCVAIPEKSMITLMKLIGKGAKITMY